MALAREGGNSEFTQAGLSSCRCCFGEEQTAVKQSVDVERDSEVRTGKEAPKSYGELARSRAR